MKKSLQIIDSRHGMNESLRVCFETYRNGQRAILLETLDGEPWTDATRAVQVPIPTGCVAVKNYSENEGLLAVLIAGGVLEPDPVGSIPSGFVNLPVHRLTAAALALAEGA